MTNYIHLQVLKFIKETNDSTSIVMKSINAGPISFLPGQFLTFFLDFNGEKIRFLYSITSLPDELPLIKITVKQNLDKHSESFLELIKIGDNLKTLSPLGNFILPVHKHKKSNFIFFGSGSGITPLFPMIKYALKNNIANRIYLYYGNRDESSIIFYKELSDLEKRFSEKLKIVHYLSNPNKVNNYINGRLTKDETIRQLNLIDPQIVKDSEYFICGPIGMITNIIEGLENLNIDSNNIHTENFSFQILDFDDNIKLIDREVIILLSGKQYKIRIKAGNTILQQALREDINIPNSCNYGACGACKAKLISGTIMLSPQTALTKNDIERGFCLTCVGYPISENIIILYENLF